MNTKIILVSSAFVLGLIGIVLTFMPKEILLYLDVTTKPALTLVMQITGAFYFAFAMLNWMSKGTLIGGIYNRPVSVANFSHFVIGGLALLKGVVAHPEWPPVLFVLALIYVVYGIAFALILFRHPIDKKA